MTSSIRDLRLLHELKHRKQKLPLPLQELPDRALVRPIPYLVRSLHRGGSVLGFLPTRAYRPGTPGATTFLSPLSGTFNYGWDSFSGRHAGCHRRLLARQPSSNFFPKPLPMLPAPQWGTTG